MLYTLEGSSLVMSQSRLPYAGKSFFYHDNISTATTNIKVFIVTKYLQNM
jgi:hypothetical protein